LKQKLESCKNLKRSSGKSSKNSQKFKQ